MDGIQQGTSPSLQHIAEEHHELARSVQSLRKLLVEPIAEQQLDEAFVELRTRLGELLRRMDAHFRQEAAGGYLEEAVARAPRLATMADALEREHPQLYAAVERLLKAAAELDVSSEAWGQIAAEYGEFARCMLAHEANENRLLQQGFNADPALFD